MSANETRDLIEAALERMLDELPALRKLPLEFQLELRGRGDSQLYRVQLSGDDRPAVIERGGGEGAKIILGVTRPHFNVLSDKGSVSLWKEAFQAGHAHVAGPPKILQLIANVVERHEKRVSSRRRG